MAIKIVIVEDDVELLNAIRVMLETTNEVEVLDVMTSAEEFMENIHQLEPEVVVIDIGLPRMSGIECVRTLKPEFPGTQFMMWTSFDDNEKIFDALKAGASGYLLKSSSIKNIIESIQDIHKGGSPMSSSIARKVIATFHTPVSKEKEYHLTSRENEILQFLAKGYRYKEIAAELFISIETVRTHIRNMYEKLQVQSRTEALNKVYKNQ